MKIFTVQAIIDQEEMKYQAVHTLIWIVIVCKWITTQYHTTPVWWLWPDQILPGRQVTAPGWSFKYTSLFDLPELQNIEKFILKMHSKISPFNLKIISMVSQCKWPWITCKNMSKIFIYNISFLHLWGQLKFIWSQLGMNTFKWRIQ